MTSLNVPNLLLGISWLIILVPQFAHQDIFSGKSFSLRSTVHNSERTISYHIQESYSVEQRRAKLNYQITSRDGKLSLNAPETGVFYLDTNDHTTILFDPAKYDCKESSIDDLTSLLGLSSLESLQYDDEDHFVGPTRLLSFLALHKDKMRLVHEINLFNIECILYELEYTNKKEEKLSFNVYYSIDSLASDQDAIPVHVQFIAQGHPDLLIKFSRIELIAKPNNGPLSDSNHVQLRSGTQVDPFTYPFAAGCSKALSRKSMDLFASRPRDKTRFSFKTEITFMAPLGRRPNALKLRFYVAFDAALNSLRIDLGPPLEKIGVRRQLFNFKLNRRYHNVELLSRRKNIFEQVAELSAGAGAAADESLTSYTTTQCRVSRVFAPNKFQQTTKSSDLLSLGKLLVGADKFVYLGLAQVRGIQARVYEAYETSLPFWLDQPIAYQTASGEWRLREPQVGVKPEAPEFVYNVILHVIDQEAHGPQLLQMEISKLSTKGQRVHSRELVRFYDFMWDLEHRALDGDLPSELFSLEDLCSGSGVAEHARVELFLESKSLSGPNPDLNDPNDFKLTNTQARHLALLASLQETLNLPATMVYDLESKLLGVRESDMDAQSYIAMALSFRVAEHADNLVNLIYIGKGGLKDEYTGQGTKVRTFKACFYLAAHQRDGVYFAFDKETHDCFVDTDPAVGPFEHNEHPPTFDMSSSGAYEIYRTSLTTDPLKAKSGSWLEDMSKAKNKLSIIGQSLKLLAVGPEKSDLEFTIKRIRVDDRDYKLAPGASVNNKQQVRSDLISGFGLIESARQCKRILPAPLLSSNQSPLSSYLKESSTEMTQEQCQAACLSDISCQSYSICWRDAEVKCVTSQLSFKSKSIVDQLDGAAKKNLDAASKKHRQLAISMDDGKPLELSRDMNCDLYNKVYLNLFNEPHGGRIALRGRRLQPVQSEEECAEMCFRRNVQILHEDISHARKTVDALAQSKSGEMLENEAMQMQWAHRNITNQLCNAFLYLDRSRLERDVDESELKRSMSESDQQVAMSEFNGYCIVGDKPSKDAVEETSSAEGKWLRMDMYQFRVEIFYEKQYGTALIRAGMTVDEHEAYRRVSSRRKLELGDKLTMPLMKTMVAIGDNFQEVFDVDESSCALRCFMQSWGPWPACRSFDIIYEQRVDEDKTRVTCYLNSITMHQAIETQRYDLIRMIHPRQHQMWHYEPRPGFVLDASNLSAESQETESDFMEYLRTARGSLTFNHFGMFLIFTIALGSGFTLGLKLGSILLARQRARDDLRSLIKTPTIVEFSNQVNSEGVVF